MKKTFDYNGAKNAGYTDEDISKFLKANPEIKLSSSLDSVSPEDQNKLLELFHNIKNIAPEVTAKHSNTTANGKGGGFDLGQWLRGAAQTAGQDIGQAAQAVGQDVQQVRNTAGQNVQSGVNALGKMLGQQKPVDVPGAPTYSQLADTITGGTQGLGNKFLKGSMSGSDLAEAAPLVAGLISPITGSEAETGKISLTPQGAEQFPKDILNPQPGEPGYTGAQTAGETAGQTGATGQDLLGKILGGAKTAAGKVSGAIKSQPGLLKTLEIASAGAGAGLGIAKVNPLASILNVGATIASQPGKPTPATYTDQATIQKLSGGDPNALYHQDNKGNYIFPDKLPLPQNNYIPDSAYTQGENPYQIAQMTKQYQALIQSPGYLANDFQTRQLADSLAQRIQVQQSALQTDVSNYTAKHPTNTQAVENANADIQNVKSIEKSLTSGALAGSGLNSVLTGSIDPARLRTDPNYAQMVQQVQQLENDGVINKDSFAPGMTEQAALRSLHTALATHLTKLENYYKNYGLTPNYGAPTTSSNEGVTPTPGATLLRTLSKQATGDTPTTGNANLDHILQLSGTPTPTPTDTSPNPYLNSQISVQKPF